MLRPIRRLHVMSDQHCNSMINECTACHTCRRDDSVAHEVLFIGDKNHDAIGIVVTLLPSGGVLETRLCERERRSIGDRVDEQECIDTGVIVTESLYINTQYYITLHYYHRIYYFRSMVR